MKKRYQRMINKQAQNPLPIIFKMPVAFIYLLNGLLLWLLLGT